MASRLTSSEIVLGKLLVRMLYLMVLLGVSLPVLSLLVLMGGIDPKLVLLTCGATFSTAWFLASLSIWVSTIAHRVRDAFFIAYGLECLWLFSPLLLQLIANRNWPTVSNAAHWCAEWVGASSPVEVGRGLAVRLRSRIVRARLSEVEVIAWMMGLQLTFGLFLACWRPCSCVRSFAAGWWRRSAGAAVASLDPDVARAVAIPPSSDPR